MTQTFKFRLNIGQHVGHDQNGDIRLWRQGQRIHTKTNLSKRLGSDKFTRISDGDDTDPGEPFKVEGYAAEEINRDDGRDFPQEMSEVDEGMSQGQHMDSSIEATYSSMTIEDLTKIAAEEEIPLGSAKLKKDIIAKILQYQNDSSRV